MELIVENINDEIFFIQDAKCPIICCPYVEVSL